ARRPQRFQIGADDDGRALDQPQSVRGRDQPGQRLRHDILHLVDQLFHRGSPPGLQLNKLLAMQAQVAGGTGMNDPDLVTDSGLSVQAGRYAPYYLSVLNNRLAWGASQLYLHLFDIGLNEWRILSALRNEPGIQALRVGEM